MKVPNQTEVGMWQEIQKFCYFKFYIERTAGALRIKWQTTARGVKIYLAAGKCVYSNPQVGQRRLGATNSDEDVLHLCWKKDWK